MRVIFMGTPAFAVPTLDAIVEAGHDVLAVVAQPDKPVGRGKKMRSPATVVRARELGIETRQPRAVRRGPFPEWMESCGADVAVVVAYGRILTPRLLQAPRLGCINVHGSILPRYRGAGPIQWALIRGEAETGVCTMQMDEGMDTGDVLLEVRTPIEANETAGELGLRLAPMGAGLLVKTLAALEDIRATGQDHEKATHAPLLTKETGHIDWRQSAQDIHNLVRGVNPWPMGQAVFRDAPLKIRRTRLASGSSDAVPGTVVIAHKELVVATGDGLIALVEVQAPGKKAQPGSVFCNGARVEVGERLTSPAPGGSGN